jgi:hypothetical protein
MAGAFSETVRCGALTFVFRASPVANVAYQLDSMAGLLRTPPPVFAQRYAEEPPGLTAEDRAAIDRWRATQLLHRHSVSVDDATFRATAYPLPIHHVIELPKKLRQASLLADDLDGYAQRIALLTTPRHADALLGVLGRFLLRFQRWWDDRYAASIERFVRGFERLLDEHGLFAFINDVARFYGADVPARHPLHFHFIVRTDRNGEGLHGEQIESHAVVEHFSSQAPEGRIDVVLHELFHYLFASAPRARHEALIRAFAAAPPSHAWAAYNLLDEAIAAALGNGLVARAVRGREAFEAALREERSLYGHIAVDRLAKALVPILERAIVSGRGALDERFVPAYLETARRTLGRALDAPALHLWTMALVTDPATRAPAARFAAAIEARSVFELGPVDDPAASRALALHPHLSGAVFVQAADLRRLRGFAGLVDDRALAALERAAEARSSFVYGLRRSTKAHVFVVAGRTEADLDVAADRLRMAEASFDGPVPA